MPAGLFVPVLCSVCNQSVTGTELFPRHFHGRNAHCGIAYCRSILWERTVGAHSVREQLRQQEPWHKYPSARGLASHNTPQLLQQQPHSHSTTHLLQQQPHSLYNTHSPHNSQVPATTPTFHTEPALRPGTTTVRPGIFTVGAHTLGTPTVGAHCGSALWERTPCANNSGNKSPGIKTPSAKELASHNTTHRCNSDTSCLLQQPDSRYINHIPHIRQSFDPAPPLWERTLCANSSGNKSPGIKTPSARGLASHNTTHRCNSRQAPATAPASHSTLESALND